MQADADEMSQRSVILDGSPKSQHPASHLGGASQFGVMFNDPDLQSDPMHEHCLDSSGRCNGSGLQDVMVPPHLACSSTPTIVHSTQAERDAYPPIPQLNAACTTG